MTALYQYFDISGGNDALSGYAFPEVHKFDASAFYNWEQDNLPILDLETRSDVLKQYVGLTDLTGVTLTVSSTAPKSASATGVYQTVQDALEVVPRRLRFPLLIEICDFGNLGDLHLADIHCEGDGALQIECRQFADSYDAQAASVSSSAAYGPSATQSLTFSIDDTISNALSGDIQAASSTKLALPCSSIEAWDNHARVFFAKTPDSQDQTQLLGFAPFPRQNNGSFVSFISTSLAIGTFNTNPYTTEDEVTVENDADPKTQNGQGASLLESRIAMQDGDTLTVAAWGAHFNKVTVRNCSRIKLKNICVDSASGTDYQFPHSMVYLCDTGVDVINSNILLENFAVCRAKNTGIRLQDSTVSVAGHSLIHRVYDRTLERTRLSEGVGVFAADSNIAFDTQAGAGTNNYGTVLRSISKCGVGLHAVNSNIVGGATSTGTVKNAGGVDTDTSRLQVFGNGTGIKLVNSVYDLEGRTLVFANTYGFNCFESTLIFQQFSVDYNQEEGFYLDNSILRYGKDAETLETGISGTVCRAFTCDYNGINVHADKNSSVGYVYECSSVPAIDMWGGSWSGTGYSNQWLMSNHGTDGVGSSKAPCILITNNSNAEFVNLAVGTTGSTAGVAGACIRSQANSEVVLRGTQKSYTCLGTYGTQNIKNNWTTAAAAALDNSEIIFTGPTKISRTGLGALAQNNSRIAFGPPTNDYVSWVPSVEKFALSSADNHTTVDIHATRACLVANDKSTIEIKNLGGSSLDPTNSVDSSQNFDLSSTFETATSGSFFRFSPNAFTEQCDTTIRSAANFNTFERTAVAFSDGNHTSQTTGGMCVRAVGASKVDVNIVNFKVDAGLSQDLSGAFYNYYGSGTEFDDTIASGIISSQITNICDLVTNCCTTVVTTVVTTGATTTPTTVTTPTTTPSSTTFTIPTIPPPSETWELAGRVLFEVDGLENPRATSTQSLQANYENSSIDTSLFGSRIHLWNIADTSRLHAANLLINGSNPQTECVNNVFHGPTGRWHNGAGCDYYGKYGFAASALTVSGLGTQVNGFYNLGVFRLVGSHRGYLKGYSEVDYQGIPINSHMTGGGSPLDQVNSQGYQTMFDVVINTIGAEDTVSFHVGLEPGLTSGTEPVFGRGLAGLPNLPGKMNGLITHARMAEGRGMLWDEGQLHPVLALPPLHVDWQGYIRNWVDESAANVFANARHGANKKVNLVSIYRSSTDYTIGGEGRDTDTVGPTFGVGVRSLNIFDLNRLL